MTPQPEAAPAAAPPPPPPPPRPIFVIKRKKAGHGGHHGGAWKVAYADFVTAMMALFIVLWLMCADEKVKTGDQRLLQQSHRQWHADRHGRRRRRESPCNWPRRTCPSSKEKMEQALKTMPKFQDMKEHIEMTITVDGLRIELLETQAGMFFESGRPSPTATGAELLTVSPRNWARCPTIC